MLEGDVQLLSVGWAVKEKQCICTHLAMKIWSECRFSVRFCCKFDIETTSEEWSRSSDDPFAHSDQRMLSKFIGLSSFWVAFKFRALNIWESVVVLSGETDITFSIQVTFGSLIYLGGCCRPVTLVWKGMQTQKWEHNKKNFCLAPNLRSGQNHYCHCRGKFKATRIFTFCIEGREHKIKAGCASNPRQAQQAAAFIVLCWGWSNKSWEMPQNGVECDEWQIDVSFQVDHMNTQ